MPLIDGRSDERRNGSGVSGAVFLHRLNARDRRDYVTLIKYAGAGLFVTALDVAALDVFLHLKVPAVAAISLALTLAGTVQFAIYRYYVFRGRRHAMAHQIRGYIMTLLAACFATTLLVMFFTRLLHIPTIDAKLLALPIVVPFTYLLARKVFQGGLHF